MQKNNRPGVDKDFYANMNYTELDKRIKYVEIWMKAYQQHSRGIKCYYDRMLAIRASKIGMTGKSH